MTWLRTGKEIARHALNTLGVSPRKDHLKGANRAERFGTIYRDGIWQCGDDGAPLSGAGSSLAATQVLRETLPALLGQLGAQTLVDVGCGDFTWMRQIDLPTDYIGLDVVPWVIERNRSLYAEPGREFRPLDIVTTPAPAGDVVLCREVLFHLSLEDGLAALHNMLEGGCSHLLLTSDGSTRFNAQIESGDFRLINLAARPYSLPEPARKIADEAVEGGRFMGLWSAAAVRSALGAR